jgi:hypothetical protein
MPAIFLQVLKIPKLNRTEITKFVGGRYLLGHHHWRISGWLELEVDLRHLLSIEDEHHTVIRARDD